jgi:hypothetical protein
MVSGLVAATGRRTLEDSSPATPAGRQLCKLRDKMKTQIKTPGISLLLGCALLGLSSQLQAQITSGIEPGELTRSQLNEAYGKLPLSFEANQGQTDSQVRFLSRGSGYSLFLTESEAVLALTRRDNKTTAKAAQQRDLLGKSAPPAQQSSTTAVLRMKLIGAAESSPKLRGEQELLGKVNYFTGNDPKK